MADARRGWKWTRAMEKNALAFRIRSTHGRRPLLGVEAEERNIYKKPDAIQTGTQDLEKNPPCNAEDNPRAGLMDYEDTRLKTSSRVRMGLSLAWKTSLAIRYEDLLPL